MQAFVLARRIKRQMPSVDILRYVREPIERYIDQFMDHWPALPFDRWSLFCEDRRTRQRLEVRHREDWRHWKRDLRQHDLLEESAVNEDRAGWDEAYERARGYDQQRKEKS